MPGVAPPPVYPESLTLANLAYFLAAPTLVYQVAYPRSSRFRLRWTLWCERLAVCYGSALRRHDPPNMLLAP